MIVGGIKIGPVVPWCKGRLKGSQRALARRSLKGKSLTARVEFHWLGFYRLIVSVKGQGALDRTIILIFEHGPQVQIFAAISLTRREQFRDCYVGDGWPPGRNYRVYLEARCRDGRQKVLDIALVFPAVGK